MEEERRAARARVASVSTRVLVGDSAALVPKGREKRKRTRNSPARESVAGQTTHPNEAVRRGALLNEDRLEGVHPDAADDAPHDVLRVSELGTDADEALFDVVQHIPRDLVRRVRDVLGAAPAARRAGAAARRARFLRPRRNELA